MPIRPKRISTRPADEPHFANVTGMDFEKRRMIFPPGFIKEIVLKGGDEYVTADDLATIVNLVVDNIGYTLQRIETHLSEITGEELKEEEPNEN